MKKNSIHILSKPNYAPEQSDPINQKFVWSYEIIITNSSADIIQLLTRFWRITDMTGRIEEIHGTGVIGLQPLIKPDKQFVYMSYCQLTTPQGTMEGHYVFQNLDDQLFEAEIPKFILSAPSNMTKMFKSKLH